jgi:hypothetical protein
MELISIAITLPFCSSPMRFGPPLLQFSLGMIFSLRRHSAFYLRRHSAFYLEIVPPIKMF